MKLKINLLIIFSISLVPSLAAAMHPRSYSDVEKSFFQAFYESCKKAVSEGVSEENFSKTLCYSHLKGSEEALAAVYDIAFYSLLVNGKDLSKELDPVFAPVREQVCAPDKLTPFIFAKDYVTFVESPKYAPYTPPVTGYDEQSEDEKKKQLKASRKYYQSPAALFTQIYACNTKQGTKDQDGK